VKIFNAQNYLQIAEEQLNSNEPIIFDKFKGGITEDLRNFLASKDKLTVRDTIYFAINIDSFNFTEDYFEVFQVMNFKNYGAPIKFKPEGERPAPKKS